MRCPYCQSDKDKVIDSRSAEEGKAIRRRRECQTCHKRFTTYEKLEQITQLTVIKRDGTRVPMDEQKMFNGLNKACYKRPVSQEQLTEIVTEVREELLASGRREIDAIEIGNMLADRLRRVDQVAYVRFASVYKQFRNIDELMEEVRQVIDGADHLPSTGQGKLF